MSKNHAPLPAKLQEIAAATSRMKAERVKIAKPRAEPAKPKAVTSVAAKPAARNTALPKRAVTAANKANTKPARAGSAATRTAPPAKSVEAKSSQPKAASTKKAPVRNARPKPAAPATKTPTAPASARKAAKPTATKPTGPAAKPVAARVTDEPVFEGGMLWKMSGKNGVAYIKDAAVAGELLATEPKNLAREAMAVYYNKKGKAIAWQVRFDTDRWEEVRRRLA